ncbi:hypothetical protein WBP06_08705 [Novosphingobium sp. BL-8H]|uniref:hypothetical protein n=1 Tax=Novosphingobium sp. BL-8H TaxID=3127640 RepID=UPI003757B39E
MTPRLNVFLLFLLMLVGLPLYWFQFDASAPGALAKPLEIAQLRTLADASKGQRPTEIRHELIGTRISLHNQLAAGTGLRPIRTGVRAYQLVVPGSRPILIDAGTTPELAKDSKVRDYDEAAQARIDHEAAQAGLLLRLLDRPVHSGNPAVRSPHAVPLPDLSDGRPHAVAPGIVVIPQPGLPYAPMMIFVQLADGREFLFTGDIAQVPESWQSLRPPARRLADIGHPHRRTEIASWLMTIRALHQAAPGMVIVTGHDPAAPQGIPWRFVQS